VTGADILRIERALGLSFWDFVCRWADPDGIIANKHAPQFHFSDDPRTPFVICLTHDDSEFLKGTTKCSFLVEGAPDAEHPCGVARCGIYQSRPAACRAFPTKLNATNDLAVIYDVPACGRKDPSPAYQLCPRPWQPADLDGLETFQSLVVAKAEMEFFADVADVWNRKPRAWAIFPDFLKLVYSTRIRREHETAAVAEPAAVRDSSTPLRRAA
jgi:hypothetical protein